ncbi:MAG: hypothetical protein JW751_16975 [Polyangiaceae bacterium]|nr:hypothetical protein [Polyangiaceae bacterium]
MSKERTTVVVLERGSAWPSCLTACRRFAPNTVVIAQDELEHPMLLARRVQARVARLVAEGRPIEAAVIAVGEEPTASSRFAMAYAESRARTARVLLRYLNETSDAPGTLWFSVANSAAESTRHELMALVGSLTTLTPAPRTAIALRFGEDPRAELPFVQDATIAEGVDQPLSETARRERAARGSGVLARFTEVAV